MSHSKFHKKGKSLYVSNWNKNSNRHLNTCLQCGTVGYKPGILDDGFVTDQVKGVIKRELMAAYEQLSLDEYNCCSVCAEALKSTTR